MVLQKPKYRIAFLAVLFGATIAALGRAIIAPIKMQDPQSLAFTFPEIVPLSGWTLQSTEAILPAESKPFVGRRYQYRRESRELAIAMRFSPGPSGDVEQFVRIYLEWPAIAEVRQQENTGYYGLFLVEDIASLNACINPSGLGTYTASQFQSNRERYGRGWQRLLPWLLGRQSLIEQRCLWTSLSMSVEDNSTEAYRLLEQVWPDWYTWWRSRFEYF